MLSYNNGFLQKLQLSGIRGRQKLGTLPDALMSYAVSTVPVPASKNFTLNCRHYNDVTLLKVLKIRGFGVVWQLAQWRSSSLYL